MNLKHFLITGWILFIFFNILVHTGKSQTIKVPVTLDRWDTIGVFPIIETFQGKESMLLKSGGIIIKDVDLRDGIIEADISFSQMRGFPGIAFRMQDLNNFENFYVRPHQSGNPDATQYTPVFNSNAGWQLYHGEGFTKAVTYKFEQWHHVKIDLHGLQADIYIDNMQTPVIKVKELMHGWKGGKFGFISGGVPLRIANVEYTTRQGGAVPAPIPVPASGTDGVITQWQVSNAVHRNLFEKNNQLTPAMKAKFTWKKQHSDPSGTINLSRFGRLSDTTNTIIARVIIESKSDQVKAIQFGFSDFVTVYLNDKALYSGSDNFLSRDYRFLGTIGYFDKLFLPLKKGVNELWFVVSENFGGWGVKVKFDTMENISLN